MKQRGLKMYPDTFHASHKKSFYATRKKSLGKISVLHLIRLLGDVRNLPSCNAGEGFVGRVRAEVQGFDHTVEL